MSEAQQATEYLFLFSIGPVQSFIASARKTQDLWAGSFLLSHLVREAAAAASGHPWHTEVIFPGLVSLRNRDAAALSNHVLLHLESGWTPSRINGLGEFLKGKIEGTFKGMAASGIKLLNAGRIQDISDRQLKDALDVFWAAVPLQGNYGDAFSALETALAGRKLIRTFDQPDPEGSLKCSLCGEREALHREGEAEVGKVKKFWESFRKRGFAEHEYLCSICLGKRFAPDWFCESEKAVDHVVQFPSTAEVAASAYRMLVFKHARAEHDLFENSFANKGPGKTGQLLPFVQRDSGRASSDAVDAHWLFKENLKGRNLEREGIDPTFSAEFGEKVKAIHDAVKKGCPGAKPSPYYAVLVMDADRMGRKLSRISSIRQHDDISQCLAEFAAGKVREVVEGGRHFGKLVYSGGDDLLAFVAVDSLLLLMEDLRSAFSCLLNGRFPALTEGGADPFTISAGACITHYKAPLRVALAKARSMLDLAKSENGAGRNAFAISVCKHSGSFEETAAKWESHRDGSFHPVIPKLAKLSRLLRGGGLSDRFLYALRHEFAPLVNENGFFHRLERTVSYMDPLRWELKRLMLRASNEKKLAIAMECAEKEVTGEIEKLSNCILDATVGRDGNPANFFRLLDAVNTISRESVI